MMWVPRNSKISAFYLLSSMAINSYTFVHLSMHCDKSSCT